MKKVERARCKATAARHEATTIAEAVAEAISFLRPNVASAILQGSSLLAYIQTYYATSQWRETSIKSVIRQMQRPQIIERINRERLHTKRQYRVLRVGNRAAA